MPRFSVIVPTTRSHLLRGALKSILNQEFGDFEIIVSDNWSEGAESVVESLADARIRYFRTPTRFAMPESWEFGLQKAEGEFVLYLGDDDAFIPQTLSTLQRESVRHPDQKIFNWGWASFFDPDWPRTEQAGKLCIPEFSGKRSIVRCEDVLQDLFDVGDARLFAKTKRLLPSVLHACCHRDVTERAIREGGRFFYPSCPDYASATVMLAFEDAQLVIDEPFVIYGVTKDSNAAASIGERRTYWQWYNEFKEPIFERVPLKSPTLTRNAIADTVMNVKSAFPARLGRYSLGLASYFKNCIENIRFLEANGVDMSTERAEFTKVLAEQADAVRSEVRAFMEIPVVEAKPSAWSELYRTARSIAGSVPGLRAAVHAVRRAAAAESGGSIVDARAEGLLDIADCALYLGDVVRKSSAGAP